MQQVYFKITLPSKVNYYAALTSLRRKDAKGAWLLKVHTFWVGHKNLKKSPNFFELTK